MKICYTCKIEKSFDDFNKRNIRDGYQHHCRECQNRKQRLHYREKPEIYLKSKRRSKLKAIKYLLKEKDKPCADCGLKFNPWQMDFDHLTDNKEFDVSYMTCFGYSIGRIKQEIAKCELVCSNCHRNRTHFRNIKRFKS